MTHVPQKYFYTIGDVCKVTGTKPHILRYWESQFKLLRPARRYSGHRKYTQEDIDLIHRIRYLILERKFTLAGAKKEIARQFSRKSPATGTDAKSDQGVSLLPLLHEVKKEVDECLEILRPVQIQQELVGLR